MNDTGTSGASEDGEDLRDDTIGDGGWRRVC